MEQYRRASGDLGRPGERGLEAQGARFPWLSALIFLLALFAIFRPDRPLYEWLAAPVRAEPRPVTARGDLGVGERRQIELFETASSSVVSVHNLGIRRDFFSRDIFKVPQGAGSGFVWDDRGHIVTNYHVIHRAQEVEVTLSDNRRLKARVVGGAPDKDLAVLRLVEGLQGLKPLPVGTSGDLKVGQNVLAIGNPFGLDQTMTTGIISALGREIQGAGGRTINDVIQTDASINPGNSGGPLLDSAGRLIGVTTAIYSTSGSSAGIGFAVPVDTVNRVVPQLITHGRVVRPTLGVHLVAPHIASRLGVQRGVLVLRVLQASGAEAAGLRGTVQLRQGVRLGDVLIGVGDHAVDNTDDLLNALETYRVGQKVDVRALRDGAETRFEVELGDGDP
ncbi:MAG: S1C family serine protease [Planctomycetota bacterium]|jgi:S1-C subfamily serine protease